jgi:ferredoxin
MMRALHVYPDRCQGHARCVAFAPDAFELDEEGVPAVLGRLAAPQLSRLLTYRRQVTGIGQHQAS